MLTEKDRARIVAQESKAFLDESFGQQLDLSGSPDLVPLVDQPFSPSDRHGLNNVQVPGSNSLKEFASNPDDETLTRLSQETGDPDFAEHVRDEQEGAIAETFVRSHPGYFRSDDNYNIIREYLDSNNLPFTSENLDLAFKTLARSGQLEMKPGTAKSLSESEQLHIISLCKAGQLEDAVSQYLDYSLPDAEEHWSNTTAFLSDPNSLTVRNQACKFVWFHSRPVQDTPDFRAYEKVYFKHRPVRTVADYDDCYCAFEAHDKVIQRDRAIYGDAQREPDEAVEQLNDLSDVEVARLTQSTLQTRARQMLKARRRIS